MLIYISYKGVYIYIYENSRFVTLIRLPLRTSTCLPSNEEINQQCFHCRLV